jgi:hypothetical protein
VRAVEDDAQGIKLVDQEKELEFGDTNDERNKMVFSPQFGMKQ